MAVRVSPWMLFLAPRFVFGCLDFGTSEDVVGQGASASFDIGALLKTNSPYFVKQIFVEKLVVVDPGVKCSVKIALASSPGLYYAYEEPSWLVETDVQDWNVETQNAYFTLAQAFEFEANTDYFLAPSCMIGTLKYDFGAEHWNSASSVDPLTLEDFSYFGYYQSINSNFVEWKTDLKHMKLKLCPDTSPPNLVSSSPNYNSTVFFANQLSWTFDEPVQLDFTDGAISIQDTTEGGGTVKIFLQSQCTILSEKVVKCPWSDAPDRGSFALGIPKTSVSDMFSNNLSSDISIIFNIVPLPTSNPTTINPTLTPTNNPTTVNPTTVNPTTVNPTQNPTTSNPTFAASKARSKEEEPSESSNSGLIYGGIIGGVVFLGACIVVFLKCREKKKTKQKQFVKPKELASGALANPYISPEKPDVVVEKRTQKNDETVVHLFTTSDLLKELKSGNSKQEKASVEQQQQSQLIAVSEVVPGARSPPQPDVPAMEKRRKVQLPSLSGIEYRNGKRVLR